jgi:hypothetical protein
MGVLAQRAVHEGEGNDDDWKILDETDSQITDLNLFLSLCHLVI